MASAALPRRAAGSRCGRRGRQPALRRPRAADAGARGRARQAGPVRGRLVRDLRGVGRCARRARRRALARRGPEGGGRGPAGGAPGGHSSHADALRDAPALGARDRVERQAMRLDELTRPDFPILERVVNGHPLVYLDSAASSQRPWTVIEAMSQYYARSHANVHRSIHTLGEEATELYEAARDRVQRFIGAQHREEVIFTRGTTDGLSLLAETIGRTLRAGDEVLITELEHHSNIVPWQLATRDRGAVLKAVPLGDDGTLDLGAFERLLTRRTRVVAFAHVSNVLPWRFEPGTPPIAEAVGLSAAIEYLEKLGMDAVAEHERALTRQTLEGLAAIPGVRVYGPPASEARGAVVAFSVEGLHPHDVAALLDAEGIAVRAGHHCAMPLIRRLGVVGTSRATFSVFNSPDEVSLFLATVAGLRSAL